jgi:hypothetical protein
MKMKSVLLRARTESLNTVKEQSCQHNCPLYRMFTKEWCGFKNLLNDYILQLDCAPPIFTGMYES